MENVIVKFKTDLKKFQVNRKKILAQCESELAILKRIVNKDNTVFQEYSKQQLLEKLSLVKLFGYFSDLISIIINGKKKAKKEAFEQMNTIYNALLNFYQYLQQQHLITQNIINAFENDKIKDPINDISQLFSQFKHTSLPIEDISRIIGMAISFNSQYAKRNKNHKIKNIDIIDILSHYYNPDGTFKFNEDILSFDFLMKELDNLCLDNTEIIYRLFNLKEIDFCSKIVMLLIENNERLISSRTNTTEQEEIIPEEKTSMSPETITALQELRKYYKNGSIVAIPDNLEEFYVTLSQCGLDEAEQKYIISLINDKTNKDCSLTTSKFLTKEQLAVYQNATNLLDTLNYSNVDAEILRQYLEEIQTILQMLETEINEEDRHYLSSEIPSIIEQLSLICDKYTIKDDRSSNRFIFLLNKNGIPYIYDDIEQLEQSNKKAVYSLFTKIDKCDKSQFKRIFNNEPLAYSMYEVRNPRAHIAFIEIDAGIYLIVGADIPRNGYKELNNRLKANQPVIKQIEETVKNPQTREQILKAHEEYTNTFTDPSDNRTNKLTLKAHK